MLTAIEVLFIVEVSHRRTHETEREKENDIPCLSMSIDACAEAAYMALTVSTDCVTLPAHAPVGRPAVTEASYLFVIASGDIPWLPPLSVISLSLPQPDEHHVAARYGRMFHLALAQREVRLRVLATRTCV